MQTKVYAPVFTDSIASSYSIQDFIVGIYVEYLYDNNWNIGTIKKSFFLLAN